MHRLVLTLLISASLCASFTAVFAADATTGTTTPGTTTPATNPNRPKLTAENMVTLEGTVTSIVMSKDNARRPVSFTLK
ncbi:MAG TPA: hypothetical protein VGM23_15920, partial [Armatimonadota bacterium]